MTAKQITIAIDGPAGSGKGTTARGVAKRLGYNFLDTGALYRAVTWYFLEHDLDPLDPSELEKVLQPKYLHIDFDDENKIIINDKLRETEIRSEAVNRQVSTVFARIPKIRAFVSQASQDIIAGGGYVLDGRDAATVIAPDAELKVYLDCDPEERARRRALEFGDPSPENVQKVLREIIIPRDEADRADLENGKAIGILVDTTNLQPEEQIEAVVRLTKEKISE